MTRRSLVRSRVTGLLAICFFNSEKAEDVFKFQHKKKKESVQGKVGWNLDRSGLVQGVPAHGWNKMIIKVHSNPNYSRTQ